MIKSIKEKIRSKRTWMLLAIILLGAFLRTYEFRDWLSFERDQVRDAEMVRGIVEGDSPWPVMGATMKDSGDRHGKLFQMGPIYYHMQIVSAKIFGSGPEKLAYPDLFFSLLALPLFYFFLRKFFSSNISLALSALYSISFFSIQFSRFAWNPNPIPFFTILFLFSLYEIFSKKSRTHWIWYVLCGIAMGVGLQLHVILFILFPLFAFFAFAYLAKGDWKILKKAVLVVLAVLILNSSQLNYEFENNFSNSRVFINSVLLNDSKKDGNFLKKIGQNLDCHLEANTHLVSSLGEDKCGFLFGKIFKEKKSKKLKKEISNPIFFLYLGFVATFSIFGGFVFFRRIKGEKNRTKKIFLKFIVVYAGLSFFIMLPAITSDHREFRYFIHLFFLPYLMLGFALKYLSEKYPEKYLSFFIAVFSVFVFSNLFFIQKEAAELLAERKSNDHFCVLGEVSQMENFISSNSGSFSEIYIDGGRNYLSTLSNALEYLAYEKNYSIIEAGDKEIPAGKPLFYITYAPEKEPENNFKDRKVEKMRNFGQVAIYKLQN